MKNYRLNFNCLIVCVLFHVIFFSCELIEPESEVEDDPYYNVDDIFHLNIYEGHYDFLIEEPGPHNIICMKTDLIYPCCNYSIIIKQENTKKAINLEIDSIYVPDLCPGALGPALYYGELILENGDVTLNILNGNVLNDFKLSVSDTLIHITPLNNSYIQVSEQLVWRYRENSFVYSCGTMEETTWIYDDFRDSILSIQGIEQFYYPDSGRIPYPRYPSGHYVDHHCLYFQYADESIWEQVKEKLVDYSINTISQYSGVGVYVENYLGEREWSWKYD